MLLTPGETRHIARALGWIGFRLIQNLSGHDPGLTALILWNSTASFPQFGNGCGFSCRTIGAHLGFCGRAEQAKRNRGARPRHYVLQHGERNRNANDPTADPQAAAAKSKAPEVTASAGMSAEARRLHARLYNDTKKAELGYAEGRQSSVDQRF